MIEDINEWLDTLGLSQYGEVFRANDIDIDVLCDVTIDELQSLGVSLGNAKRIMRAVPARSALVSAAEPPAGDGRHGAPAERRQLSVVFCDLVGSASISERLDPEDLRTYLDEYYRMCARAAADHGGQVGKVIGDGVNMYFGYPVAIESSADAAVGAALDVVDAARVLSGRTTTNMPGMQLRVGVHTGVAVVGEVGGSEFEIVGDVPVVAARVEAVAPVGTVAVTEATARLLSPEFVLTDAGRHRLKGLTGNVQLFTARRRDPDDATSDDATSDEVRRAVDGREADIASLRARWNLARQQRGQIVHLIGDAGIGKSQLIRMIVAELDRGQMIDYRCTPHRSGTPLWPIIDSLRRETGIVATGDDPASVDQLRRFLEAGKPALSGETLSLLASLIGLTTPGDLPASADELRDRTIGAILTRLVELSEARPLFVWFEDIQWADPTTLQLLRLLIAAARDSAIMVAITSRPGLALAWLTTAPVATMTLDRLDDRDARAIIQRLIGSKLLPDGVTERILAVTDGVPLFIEELTRTVLESGFIEAAEGGRMPESALEQAIPATLRDSLWARLDRLGPVREVAQVASVIGREFSVDVLAEAMDLDIDTLRRDLADVLATGLVQLRGGAGTDWFVFKHALIQSAAYDSMLRARRRELHGRLAIILGRDTRRLAESAEPVARHLDLAGKVDEAIDAYVRAGAIVAAASGHEEALVHYRRALELAESLPKNRASLERQLAAHGAIRNALVVLRGYSSDEVAEACAVARSVCEELGDADRLFPVLWNLAGFHMLRGEHEASDAINISLLGIAERSGDDSLALLAHSTVGQTRYYQGRFADAARHLATAVALYDRARHGELAFRYAEEDPGIAAGGYAAAVLWMLGERSESQVMLDHAMQLSAELPYRASQSLAVSIVVQLAYFRSRPDHLPRVVPALEEMVGERAFGLVHPTSLANLGWCRVVAGDLDDGLEMVRRGVAGLHRIGAKATTTFAEVLLADSLFRAQRHDEALAMLQPMLAAVRARRERVLEVELLGLCGLARAACGAPNDEVDLLLAEAVNVAAELGARSLRLRAAVARVRQEPARDADSREARRAAFDAINTACDDPDMTEAAALLAE